MQEVPPEFDLQKEKDEVGQNDGGVEDDLRNIDDGKKSHEAEFYDANDWSSNQSQEEGVYYRYCGLHWFDSFSFEIRIHLP